MKLCSRLLMGFCRNLCEKRQIWVSEPHSGEVRGDARSWLITCWKAHGPLSIRINWTFFRYLLPFRSYKAKCVQLGCYRRGSTSLHSDFTRFCSDFTLINHSSRQKTRDTGLPDTEDRIPLHSLVLTQYRSVTDRQTDGRTDGFAVAQRLQSARQKRQFHHFGVAGAVNYW